MPDGITGLVGRGAGREDLCGLVEMRAERSRRLQQIVFYRAGDETGGLHLEDRREK